MQDTIFETNFEEIRLIRRGKVRDIYEIDDMLLIVATDRISAFDVVMNEPIPQKGKILTAISIFWFERLKSIVENHIISTEPDGYPEICKKYSKELEGRSMLVRKAEPLPVECIVRGYISGSGWNDYRETGAICGIRLPDGLKESDRLPEPIFTPSTKAQDGVHDENITFDRVVELIGSELAEEIRSLSIKLYEEGRRYAESRGIIIADTKFEFGICDGKLILIDEVLTPDSSRFWPMDEYSPGGPQKSFDKQFLRDYLISINWPKTPPPPALPEDIIQKTRAKYIEALKRLTGKEI